MSRYSYTFLFPSPMKLKNFHASEMFQNKILVNVLFQHIVTLMNLCQIRMEHEKFLIYHNHDNRSTTKMEKWFLTLKYD